ncbi:homoserine kinase [Quadrisphaera sp. DSM 44207]|uniref:homoserine kinase n=1 Tax=Quadrisphaera sp. DSM 44207 TaxID=1881057 RepID=UPI000882E8B4|nr:homoserine kinase [Quadrisphaera sp. DSM 44207]SDQ73245.1 homoserine kinase [Quadrisphaera sp. DSM 44207]
MSERSAPAARAGRVVLGRRVRVRVPGSSANLGPGYDALGLALGVHDEVAVTAVPAERGVRVAVEGSGAGRVGVGEDHLVVRALRAALRSAGADQPGLEVVCRNGVPHGRGVGSSAAAVVAGVAAAGALLEVPLADDVLLDVASALEGHPDNAAASLLGGLTLGWHEAPPSATAHGGRWRAVRVEPSPHLGVLLCVPGDELSTARARAMLPLQVPHADAAHTAGRAALLVEAVTRRPDLLLPATEDRLHQQQRAAAMPGSWALLMALRAAGHAAVVSGAGPSVLVLCPDDACAGAAARLAAATGGWRVLRPGIARTGAVVEELAGGPGAADG